VRWLLLVPLLIPLPVLVLVPQHFVAKLLALRVRGGAVVQPVGACCCFADGSVSIQTLR